MNDLNLMNQIKNIVGKTAVIYGVNTLNFFRITEQLQLLGVRDIYAADQENLLWGKVKGDIKILSWKELQALDLERDIFIVIASMAYVTDIEKKLCELQLRTKEIYTQYSLKLAMFYNRNILPILEEKRQELVQLWKLETQHCKEDFLASIITSSSHALDNQIFGKCVHVFNPGKVGSKTVVASCFKQKLIASHAHTIIPYSLDDEEKEKIKKIYTSQNKVKIISLLREPIARDVSFFFENIWMDSYCGECENIQSAFELWMKECLYKIIPESGKFPRWYMDMNKPVFDWFDDEIKQVFDIDIFEHPFDVKKGYSVIKKNGVELLLIKLEKLNELSDIIGKFLETDSFKIYTENDSKDKEYIYLYKQFLEEMAIPKDYFEYYYGDKSRMRHFYSDEELCKFKDKWSKKIDDGIRFFG